MLNLLHSQKFTHSMLAWVQTAKNGCILLNIFKILQITVLSSFRVITSVIFRLVGILLIKSKALQIFILKSVKKCFT